MAETPFPTALVAQAAAGWGLSLTGEQLDRFARYAALLLEWNNRMNLTAITDPTEIAVKHFADSLTLLAAVDLPTGARLLDVGTGAGFPALPVGIARGDLRLTLLDSLQKRLTFLDAACAALGLQAQTVHIRAEDAGRESALREQADAVCARAVARLAALCEYCLPLTRVGGRMIALKGPEWEEELREAARAVSLLGGGEPVAHPFTLPDGSRRTVLVIPKVAPTPAAYPRRGTKIAKNPL